VAIVAMSLSPSATDAAQLTLTWTDNSGGQAATAIERKVSATGTYAEIAQVPAGTNSHVDARVEPGAFYCYRVRAFDSAGPSDYSNEACADVAASARRSRDFNGDGKADILWRDSTGQVRIWLMDGTTVRTAAIPASPPLDWTIQGVGDFDGDDKADILWRDSGGQVGIWLMDGITIRTVAIPANRSLDWTIQSVGDFDGDGKADILWRDSGGQVGIWLMDGTTIGTAASVASPSLDWTIQGAGDFDGDGKADILWREAAGQVAIWLMDGTAISVVAIPVNIEPEWTIE
jgi:hypothetical protein